MLMKKLLLFIAILSTGIISKAQITITYNDMPGNGDFFVQAVSDVIDTSLSAGDAGEDIFWDFSQLTFNQIDSVIFYDPILSPYYSDFPEANLCMSSSDINYGYIVGNNDEFTIVGIVAVMGDTMKIHTQMRKFLFPLTYQIEFADTNQFLDSTMFFGQEYNGVYVDSINMVVTNESYNLVDGWGILKTPLDSAEVLRIQTLSIEKSEIQAHVLDTIYGFPIDYWMPVQSTVDTSYEYAWIANGVGYPLMEMTVENDTVVQTKFKYDPLLVGCEKITDIKNNVNIYPNPSNGEINLASDIEMSKIMIYSIDGKLITEKQINNNRYKFNNNLNSGTYIYQVYDSQNQIIKRDKLFIIK